MSMRLSKTLPGPRAWGFCQGCAAHLPGGSSGHPGLTLWQEVGVGGDTDVRFLWLCIDCVAKHVPNDKRLVREHVFAPFAGVQKFCADCVHCTQMDCSHPQARLGLLVIPGARHKSFVDTAHAHGRTEIGWQPTYYYEPAKGCRGFEEAIEL